jgi:hypothetical protein
MKLQTKDLLRLPFISINNIMKLQTKDLLRLPFISYGLTFLDLFLATQEKLWIFFSWAL